MLEELKMTKDDMIPLQLRKEATKYALNQINIQKSQFQKFQLFANFKNKYVTLDNEFEVNQLKLFKKLIMNKLIYKGLKPIY
jgi:isoleucyl-tRNA synthetase